MGIIRNDKNAYRRDGWPQLLCSFFGFLLTSASFAGTWEVNPQFTAQEVYSDNIELAPAESAESDFVTELTPAIALRGRGTRYSVDLDYGLQGLIYAEDSGRNVILNLLTGNGQVELVRDHGFVDFTANYGPQNTGTQGIVAFDNISDVDRTNVLSYSVTPNWVQEFRNYAVATAGYTYDALESNNEDDIADSDAHTINANIHNGSHFTTWLWSVDYLERYESDETVDDATRFRNVTGRVDYFFLPHWAVIGALGYDDNRYDTTLDQDTSGVLWGIGAKWAPGRQTSFELIGGERFFGQAFSARAQHTGRRFRLVGSYAEEPTTTRATILQNTIFPVLDPFGQPIIDPTTGQPQQLDVTVPVQTTEVLISKTLNAVLGYTGRFHDFLLGFDHVNRDYQLTEDTEEVSAANAAWTWRFTPRTRSLLSFRWIDEDLRGGDESRYIVVDFALTRQLGRNLEASIGARHLDRNTTGDLTEYDENRAFVMLVKTF
jgi:uncharacterized protein (PEP-CTERM system associated)